MPRCRSGISIVLLVIAFMAAPARAVKIADITRIGGERTNILTGLGLVYGLKGHRRWRRFRAGDRAVAVHALQVWRSGDGRSSSTMPPMSPW